MKNAVCAGIPRHDFAVPEVPAEDCRVAISGLGDSMHWVDFEQQVTLFSLPRPL